MGKNEKNNSKGYPSPAFSGTANASAMNGGIVVGAISSNYNGLYNNSVKDESNRGPRRTVFETDR